MKAKITKRDLTIILSALVIGIFLGWMVFHNSGITSVEEHALNINNKESATIWTCSMHPQIKMYESGKCPICAMDLVPVSILESHEDEFDPNEIRLSASAIKLADIHTITVSKGIPEKTLHLLGIVQADERNIAEITARFGGRIEKLHINYTGQKVTEGQILGTIYSPALISAQMGLLEAVKFKKDNPTLYEASRNKLRLWNLTNVQINEIEANGEPKLYFNILSPISGTVTKRHIATGDYIKEGLALFEVIDLKKLWIIFDAYESDLPWIKIGDKIDFTVQSVPGKVYTGNVSFIEPFVDVSTRVAKVRIDFINSNLALKPGMFAEGILKSQKAGKPNEILIPKSAVLWTGKRAIVYVKVPNRKTPSFLYREIILGPEANNFYIIREGLKVGEEIVFNGVFKIDAAAQLAGLPSMMNPQKSISPVDPEQNRMDHAHGEAVVIMQHEEFRVAGNCAMCKNRIEKAVNSLAGVTDADWSIETKMLQVTYNTNEISLDEIHKTVAHAGHDTEKERAPDSVYKNLPACCLYRE